jgi:hypothetical protein
MSKLMWIAGILLIAAGLALGLLVFVSTASVVGWGIDLQVASVLLVGGILAIGLGGIINAIESRPAVQPAATYESRVETPIAPIPEFGRRVFESAPAAAAASAAATPVPRKPTPGIADEISEPVRETIQALEQARQKIENAFEPAPIETAAKPEPAPVAEVETVIVAEETLEESVDEAAEQAATEDESVEEEAVSEEEVLEEGQLYVVEERFIRARPARILSDGTVEAETEEGWMRFENIEHLNEYLDAMAPART